MPERRMTTIGRPNGSCTDGGRHWTKEEDAAKSSRGRSLARQHKVDLRASNAKEDVNSCLCTNDTCVRLRSAILGTHYCTFRVRNIDAVKRALVI